MSTSLFFSQTFRHNGSAVFGTMPPMCRSCPDVNKLRGMETTILGQRRPFMSIKSFVQHSGWQEMVSLCSLIRLIGVCADRDQPEFLCSRSDSRHLEVHVATAGGWLTRYRPREVRNSIYRYRKIHIDYWSKFLYRFISPTSIIYGNTNFLILFFTTAIFLYETNPKQWILSQHCGYWWPGALAVATELHTYPCISRWPLGDFNKIFDIFNYVKLILEMDSWCMYLLWNFPLGAISIRKTVLPGMAIPMLKIRRPNSRLIFNMEIAIRR